MEAATISGWRSGLWAAGGTARTAEWTNICAPRRGALSGLVWPGKISGVNLHRQARADVQRILVAHGPWLSSYRGCLDQSVQEVGGYWEAPAHPDFVSIDPCIRTGHVRALAGAVASRWPRQRASLLLKITPFCGLHVYTPDGQRIRTRTRPRNLQTGLPMRASKEKWVQGPPLWGHDPAAQSYELSVLLDIDLGTKTLFMASLAAIDWGAHDKGREIYYEEEIPPPAVTGLGDSGPCSDASGSELNPDSPLDDFDDMLDNGEEEAGTDPA